jgi:hypothetical protein
MGKGWWLGGSGGHCLDGGQTQHREVKGLAVRGCGEQMCGFGCIRLGKVGLACVMFH